MRWPAGGIRAVSRVVLIAAVVVLATLWEGWHPATGSAATRTYTAEYKGSLSFKADYEDYSGGPVFNRTSATLTFDAKIYTEVPPSGSPTSSGTLVAQGSYSSSSTNGPNVDTYGCTFHQIPRPDVARGLSADPSGAGATLQSLLQLNGSGNVPQGGCSQPRPVFFGLDSCGSAGCTGVCEEDYAPSQAGQFAAFQVADGPVVNTYPKTGSKTTRYEVTLDPKGRCFTGTQSVTLSIQAALTLGGGGATPPPRKSRRLTREERDAKIAALQQIRDTWGKALTACVGTAAFATLLAAGPAGTAVALVLVPAEAYQCKVYVEIIDDAANTFADPPLASDGIIAPVTSVAPPLPHLPSCQGVGAPRRALCARTRAQLLALLSADRRAAALTHAVELTISRESYAQSHHHGAAARHQDQALGALLGQLARARRTQSAAGARLAQILAAAHLQVRSSTRQSAAQITNLLGRLAPHGLTRRKLTAIDRALVRARPRDWLTALAAS
jgi:hypothetical protein